MTCYCQHCADSDKQAVDRLCVDCQHIANMQSIYDFIHDTPASHNAQENAENWRHVKRQVQLFERMKQEISESNTT